MIPGLLAQDIAQSLREFITTGFETDTWPFSGKFEALVSKSDDGDAFVKGPYVSIGLPFLKNTERLDFFSSFATEHSPFAHQELAWSRLNGARPKSTIVATGTGSGKTECFLYPLLEHCSVNSGPGIKAIIIYPMNALAGDQAKRFASVIHKTAELNGKVRVGLFIGGGDSTDQSIMGPEQVITCKKTLRDSPPDILLTNYKMLDYLLMRPKDQALWAHNREDALRYLVVDELHTFDGAQGSDLAMLIRRLKARLGVSRDNLTCVGTSATLGSDNKINELAKYAADIFDTQFDRSSIVGETRQSRDQFLGMIEYMMLDPGFKTAELRPEYYPDLDQYLNAQAKLFFGDDEVINLKTMAGRIELGVLLKKHPLTHNVLKACQGTIALKALVPAIQRQLPPNLKSAPELVIISLLSLMAQARGEEYPGQPLVSIRLQLWARELRRIVSRVGTDNGPYPVDLYFSDDLKKETDELYLPLVQCSECHTTAWLTKIDQGSSYVDQELRVIYNAFFSNDKETTLLLPLKDAADAPEMKGRVRHLCASCGHVQLNGGECTSCRETALVTVYQPDLNKSVQKDGVPTLVSQRMCPVCQAKNSLLLFGSRASSLSSVAIHQSYASRVNDDKKLIAFSDSVQDAAHRAGFFAARTWYNNVRMAVSKAIHSSNAVVPLNELYDYLPAYWLDPSINVAALDPLNYITQFIAPNMEPLEDYRNLKQNGSLANPEYLIGQINRRLAWETLQEVGVRSRVGRSLQQTGVAALGWDPALITSAAESLASTCREQLGQTISTQQSCFILWGIALKMKRQGAIYHPFMDSFIDQGGNAFLLSKISFMPNVGSYSILPRFPASNAEKGFDPLEPRGEKGWYIRWVTQIVGDVFSDNHFMGDLLNSALLALQESGLTLALETQKGSTVWALNPEALGLYKDLSSLRLRLSSSARGDADEDSPAQSTFGSWNVPSIWNDHLRDLPSLDHSSGANSLAPTFDTDPHPRLSYYKSFYLKGQIERVIAHEHTSLLERDYREDLENRFIAAGEDRKPWYENLLSATPTLEMGIDIGDLSSVMLCSVPPSQANYLQRAGRGGRKDGNSFVMTLATGKPHDLYFFADPTEMISGDVDAPAIFLNASMVLKRQLLAFCFDQWAIVAGTDHIIPASMQPVLDAIENRQQQRFPYTLLSYIRQSRDELWHQFQLLLDTQISSDTKDKLKSFLLGSGQEESSIDVYVLEQIQQMVVERKLLIRQQKDLESEIRALSKKPKDEALINEIEELNRELSGIKRLKYEFNRKETFNFLTDEGLLPNYAFPEEGTTLHSVIYRKLSKPRVNEEGVPSNFDSVVFEYSRPARAALSELAPESLFFANNKKVKIERIEMAKGENLESWRLCPSCSHSERISGADQDMTCPRCSDPMWANTSQLRNMVRLKQVYANTREDKAQIGDDSDTREPIFFNRQMLIDFEPGAIALAYEMKDKPFGFEFIREATFREINFGKQGSLDQMFNVAGNEMSRPGFRLCQECGTVQYSKSKTEHMYKCQFKGSPEGEGIVDCLYLYREYRSEAIRIVVPKLSGSDQDEQIQSFVAALQLGLKKHFGGKVDHLQLTFSDEPIPGSTERNNYLVLYDTVPGGTGYLHELLADPKNLMEMLKRSYEVMENCACKLVPELDGCYQCLYAYRNSYGMESTSRTAAMVMLNDILDGDPELVPVDHLGKNRQNGWADSPLESRFPDALQALNNHPLLDGLRIRTSKDIINGKVGFRLEVGEHIYSVEVHARLNKRNGVMYPCEPDFLITTDRASDGALPVAVFLDGYKYHKNIVHEDLMKRQGISLSRKYVSWSLSWHDVNQAFAGSEVKIPNPLRENIGQHPKGFVDQMSQQKGLDNQSRVAEISPLLMLMQYLNKPSIDWWKGFAMLRSMSWLNSDLMAEQKNINQIRQEVKLWPSQYQDQLDILDLKFATISKLSEPGADLTLYIGGSEDAIKLFDCEALFLAAVYDTDKPDSENVQRVWQKLLQVINVGQFLPNFFAATQKGINDGSFSELVWRVAENSPVEESAWDTIITLAEDEVKSFLIALSVSHSERAVTMPEVCFELEDNRGMVIAEAELAWPESRVALLLEHQIDESELTLKDQNWVLITVDTEINTVLDLLGDN